MDRKQLEEYINQLKDYEVMLSSDEVDNNFIDNLNGLIKKISEDLNYFCQGAPIYTLKQYRVLLSTHESDCETHTSLFCS